MLVGLRGVSCPCRPARCCILWLCVVILVLDELTLTDQLLDAVLLQLAADPFSLLVTRHAQRQGSSADFAHQEEDKAESQRQSARCRGTHEEKVCHETADER